MFKYLICAVALCSCVDSATPTTGTSSQGEITCDPDIGCTGGGGGDTGTGQCGEGCTNAAQCGGGAGMCRICAGMPGTGRGTCLTGNPLTGEPPDGLVEISYSPLTLQPLPQR